MDGGKFDDYDFERFQTLLSEQLGLTLDELQTWMIDEAERVDGNGKLIGHVVTFRPDMPFELRARVRGMAAEYLAYTGIIALDS